MQSKQAGMVALQLGCLLLLLAAVLAGCCTPRLRAPLQTPAQRQQKRSTILRARMITPSKETLAHRCCRSQHLAQVTSSQKLQLRSPSRPPSSGCS